MNDDEGGKGGGFWHGKAHRWFFGARMVKTVGIPDHVRNVVGVGLVAWMGSEARRLSLATRYRSWHEGRSQFSCKDDEASMTEKGKLAMGKGLTSMQEIVVRVSKIGSDGFRQRSARGLVSRGPSWTLYRGDARPRRVGSERVRVVMAGMKQWYVSDSELHVDRGRAAAEVGSWRSGGDGVELVPWLAKEARRHGMAYGMVEVGEIKVEERGLVAAGRGRCRGKAMA